MIFSSFRFLLFFPIVLALYYASRNVSWRKWFLLTASYVFYASWDWRFVFLLFGCTLLDFTTGAMISRNNVLWKRRAWLTLSVVGNVSSIAYFKYSNFFIESFRDLMLALGVPVNMHLLNVVLPVGISFYNFETMTYAIDIYRKKLEPTKSFLDFALFVSFFPHLVAGPIIRAAELLPQLRRVPSANWDDLVTGVNRFGIGFLKKVLVADALAPYVDRIFADPGAYDGLTLWCASIGFAMQCYCDFAGYTDMAIGCARFMGFWLPENFRWPFLAHNVADFWRRWHITLYSFMRDYLYHSLGGSRVGQVRQIFNAMVTMTLVGLWHGAAWPFVIWGVYNGVLIVGYRFLAMGLERLPRAKAFLASLPGAILCIATTNVLFFLSFTLFRSEGSLGTALGTAWRMITLDGAGLRAPDPWVLVAYAIVLLCSVGCELRWGERLLERLPSRGPLSVPVQAFCYVVLILVLVLFSQHDTQAFVYFQF